MVQLTSYASLRGLDLNSNPYTASSKDAGGVRLAATIADDCVITRQRMIGNRRGFDYFSSATGAPVDRFFEYQGALIEHDNTGQLWLGDATTGARTPYVGTYTAVSPYRIDGAVGRGSLFLTTANGVYKLDAIADTPVRAGLTKGLDTRATPTGTGNGFMNGFSKAAYHVTWTYQDANKQTLRSDTSQRVIITNSNKQTLSVLSSTGGVATATTPLAHGYATGDTVVIAGATQTQYNGTVIITVTGTSTFTYPVSGSPTSPATGTITAEKYMNASVAFTVPWDIPNNAKYEVWRTATVTASNADPGDDCYLVTSVVTTNALAGTTITYVDITPDSVITASTALYTNATQEGALQGNARPPVAVATASYKDYQIYANTAIDHQLSEQLLATINLVSGTSSVTINDATAARTYTCSSTESVTSNLFQLYTGGVSNAFNIENTIRSLVHVINGDVNGHWYAEYTSGVNDSPGIFRVWARSPSTGAFWLTTNNATTGNQFNPTIPASGNTIISSNDARPNRLFYSKFQQPDHVPILNTIDVGRLDQPILRVLPVRDACYVIKADGVYYLNQNTAPFSLVELDTTCQCIAPATAAALNNQIFMLSNQGVVKLSSGGVTVISFDIEPVIMGNALGLSNLASVAFGIANEPDRNYILYLPTAVSDTYAKQAYVYHTFIEEWVRWTKPAMAGIALGANYSLYLSSGLENAVLKQRRAGDNTDYSDESVALTVTSQTGKVVQVTWSSSVFTPVVGMTLHQTSVAKVLSVTQVSGSFWAFTIDRNVTFAAAAATVRMPIAAHVRLSPNVLGDTGLAKTIYDINFLLNSNSATLAGIEVSTNEAATMNTYTISRTISGGFGTTPFGKSVWGDTTDPASSTPWQIALPVPDIIGEAVTMGWFHSVSQEQFIIARISVAFDAAAEYEVTR
jgi:hypothetical protein